MDTEELYVEISEGGNSIHLVPLQFNYPNAKDEWDRNWVSTKIEIKTRSFSGIYMGDLMTVDFERFKRELTLLYDNLKGTAKFKSLEDYLEMQIKGDGLGHFEGEVKANDSGDMYGARLTFAIIFDQTKIREIVNQLNKITTKFPVYGGLKIN